MTTEHHGTGTIAGAPPLPLTAYLHLPWCVHKCPYCDFNSHTAHGEPPFAAWADALVRDMDFEAGRTPQRPLHAVFFGGGTPSLFPAPVIGRVLGALLQRWRPRRGLEVTLEANPGAADCAAFGTLFEIGVNRLSIGVQSFDNAMLQALERVHNATDALRAIDAATAAGFTNINLDLMYGLPDQRPEQALADVEQAIALGVPHISAYQLTIEPRTRFYRKPPPLPDDDTIWEMQQGLEQRLGAAGYERYEVSAWARPGHRCRHNLNYWRFGDYLGLGAGAHGKLSDNGIIRRSAKCRHPQRFMERAGSRRALDHDQTPAPHELPLEFLMNALRLCDGFAPALFTARTGLAPDCIEAPLARAVELGLLRRDDQRIAATERGLRFLNDLLGLFVPADDDVGGAAAAAKAKVPVPAAMNTAAVPVPVPVPNR